MRFYLRHPLRTAGFVREDLKRALFMRRVDYMGNYTLPPECRPARAGMTGTWSAITTRVYASSPACVVTWHGILLIASPLLTFALRSREARALAGAIAATSASGGDRAADTCLADVINTERHLLLFHLFTDATVFLSLALSALCIATSSSKGRLLRARVGAASAAL